ncbi:MAG: hypothetical protein ACQETZ_00825 [Candidatus Fermentibacterota bacterium]
MSRAGLLVLMLATVASADFVFGPEVGIDTLPDSPTTMPDVVRTVEGRFVTIWDGSSIFSAYSDDFGQSWSYKTSVSDPEAYAEGFPKIADDSLGNLYVVWHDCRGPEPYAIYFSRSLDGGETWLWPNVEVTDDGGYGECPSIASNADGSRLVTVFNRPDGPYRTYASYSTDGGLNWSDDMPIGDATGDGQYFAVVEHTSDDSFASIWVDERDTETYVYCSVSEDGGETWVQPNIPVPCGGYGPSGYSLDLHYDGSVLHAYWIEMYWLDSPVYEVYYSRSPDGGYTWLEEPARVDSGGYSVGRKKGGIWARDPENIFAVWNSTSGYTGYAVCSISSDSGKTWSVPVIANPESAEAHRCDIYGDVDTGEILLVWNNKFNYFIKCAHGYDDTGIQPEEAPRFSLSVSENPFHASVRITIEGGEYPDLLEVFDLSGRRLASLHPHSDGSFLWTGTDSSGDEVPAGAYIIRGTCEGGLSAIRVVKL